MTIEVRYQSRGGNTKAVAEIVAETAKTKAKSISEPLPEYTDILFVGGGVYSMRADKELLSFLSQLTSQRVGMIVAFSTTGIVDVTTSRIKEIARKSNIKVCEKSFCLKLLMQGYSIGTMKGGHLSVQQKDKVRKFACTILK